MDRRWSSFSENPARMTPPSRRWVGQSGSMAASRTSVRSSMLSHCRASSLSRSLWKSSHRLLNTGILPSVPARASRSLGEHLSVLTRAPMRSVSEMPERHWRICARSSERSLSSAMQSCRRVMASTSHRGMHSQYLNMRPPMPVCVASRLWSREPWRASLRIVWRISRLRRLTGSI